MLEHDGWVGWNMKKDQGVWGRGEEETRVCRVEEEKSGI